MGRRLHGECQFATCVCDGTRARPAGISPRVLPAQYQAAPFARSEAPVVRLPHELRLRSPADIRPEAAQCRPWRSEHLSVHNLAHLIGRQRAKLLPKRSEPLSRASHVRDPSSIQAAHRSAVTGPSARRETARMPRSRTQIAGEYPAIWFLRMGQISRKISRCSSEDRTRSSGAGSRLAQPRSSAPLKIVGSAD